MTTADFTPAFADKTGRFERFELTIILKSQDDGARHINRGVGVALTLEKTSAGVLEMADSAFVRIDDVNLEFIPRPRNDEVMV